MATIEVSEEEPLRNLADVANRVAARKGPVRLTGVRGAARAVVGARLVEGHGSRPILFLAPTAKAADSLLDDLRAALGAERAEMRLRAFPRYDTPPYDRFSPQPFVVAQRMEVLYRWLASADPETQTEPAPIVVAPWTAMTLHVPSRDSVRARCVHLEVGQTKDRDALVSTLIAAGYSRMPLVEEPGELSVRGGILDLFPPQRAKPVRLEMLGDEIESIREFDSASQRSLDALPYVVVAPPRELLFDRSRVIEQGDAIRELAVQQRVPAKVVDEMVDTLLRGNLPPGAESLAPLLQAEQETVLDYLPPDTLVVMDDRQAGEERLLLYAEEVISNFEAAHEAGRVVSPPDQVYVSVDVLLPAIEARHPVMLERLDVLDESEVAQFTVRALPHDELKRALARARPSETPLAPLVERLEHWREERWKVVIACPTLSGAERMRELLGEYGVGTRMGNEGKPVSRWGAAGRVEIRVVRISEGFALPLERLAILTEEEIFGPRERRRTKASWREGAAVEAIAQLRPGDYVVHAEHGIGKYGGLFTLNFGGASGDFLRLEYEGGDRLFLPTQRLNLIQRYVGSDGHVPRIDKLGGSTWEKAKHSVKRSLKDMAKELLSVHAARELAPGFSYPPRDRHLEEFEARFPFEETPDQLAAIEDIMGDLGRSRPMDRLVCGDVGYGKTEVAVRGAFQVAMQGRQVAVLVPTTVLAQQHEETFRKRFEGTPVKVEGLSRFRSPKEVREVLEHLVSGEVDIVIGTHRLLQKDVRFRDLGLLVVDEEHRFGVGHKERIKQLKKTVDVLTLTATPIPRTLQQAFTGLRDLSVINTPPADRLAIRTQVCRFSDSLIREAILREVRRGGQVFFVHNRVQTIGSIAELLAKAVPEVKVSVAHGQMREKELEEKMLSFWHGESDVLLCTTIIESGLDIPRANTIIIDRADKLGLAQLYQLRGRVGRSTHRAYAYLLIPGEDTLTDDATRRLEAIQDLSELGSGFRLANMDLEIRGAGNLLGAEQSGNLAAVGYETYMEMLDETIEEMRGHSREIEVDPEIRLPVEARLPEDYVPDVSQRLVLYKRLASTRDQAEVARLRDEMLDRYGALPDAAEHLLRVIRLKILARRLGIAALDYAKGDIVLSVAETTSIDPQRLVNLLAEAGSGMRVTPDHRIYKAAPAADPHTLFASAEQLLTHLMSS